MPWRAMRIGPSRLGRSIHYVPSCSACRTCVITYLLRAYSPAGDEDFNDPLMSKQETEIDS